MFFSPFFLVFGVFFGVSLGLNFLLFFWASREAFFFNAAFIAVIVAGLIILFRFGKRKNTWEATASCAALLLAAHIVGDMDRSLGFEAYIRYAEYDTVLHFWGGFTVGLAAITLWDPKTIDIQFLVPMLSVAGISILWEFMEFAMDKIAGVPMSGSMYDTTLDLAAAALGGFAAVNFLYLWVEHIAHKKRQFIRSGAEPIR